ncbi:MAG: Maf family protein [Pseudohongiellaceae bacterium]
MSSSSRPGLLLASASPRRHELLRQIGVRFATVTHTVDETPRSREVASDYVLRMAREKARCGASRAEPGHVVLGADTAVVLDGRILGKPRDRADAVKTLLTLADRPHQVCSAVALSDGDRMETRLSVTEVVFGSLSSSEAEAYWETGEPADKAGSYGIQGVGALFVTRIEGSYSGVVGLPLYETARLLAQFGIATALEGNKHHE